MERFYENLAQGTDAAPVTKAEALSRAQRSLIRNLATSSSDTSRALAVQGKPGARSAANSPSPFSHPYYWAPFILIGNGL